VAWTPPNAVFGPVWTALYAAMSVAVFFGLHPLIGGGALWIAAVIIVALDVLVLLTLISFWPVSRLSAALFVPYLAWVLYATTLNIGIAVLNA
jgi:benzodiazapine receptor